MYDGLNEMQRKASLIFSLCIFFLKQTMTQNTDFVGQNRKLKVKGDESVIMDNNKQQYVYCQ